MAFDHEAHKEHNKRIEEIDKKAGIGKYNPHNFSAKTKALEKKKDMAKRMSVKGMGKPPSDHYGARIPAYKKPKHFV